MSFQELIQNLRFEPAQFLAALPTFVYGMLGVFFVLSCIMGVMYFFRAFAKKPKDKN